MFDRLKSLPLTILLTILIWMYAESQVNSANEPDRVEVSDVPVYVSGPPDVLARFDVSVRPQTIKVMLTGTRDRIAPLRAQLQSGAAAAGIYAYLDIGADDLPMPPPNPYTRRLLRIQPPAGLSVAQTPSAEFQLVYHAPTTTRHEGE